MDDLIQGLRSGSIKAGDVPPIRVFEKDGIMYTLDNRRLYAFQQANQPIQIVRVDPVEVANEIARKFTTKNDGLSVLVKVAPKS